MKAMQGSTWRGHAAGVVVGALALCGTAVANTICVPDDYTTIQAAINAAVDGDEICVAPGTYNETINFIGKAVRLYGTDGPEVTIIDAAGLYDSVVRCTSGEGPETILEGFTITGGRAVRGGGMIVVAASPTVRACVFRGNTATASTASGGGLHCAGVSSAVFEACHFIDNTAYAASASGGGASVAGGNVSFTDCIFVNNTADGDCDGSGGGLKARNASLRRCLFLANAADGGSCAGFGEGWGGGASLTSAIVEDCLFVGNTARGYGSDASGFGAGGGIFGTDLFVSNSHFFRNRASASSPMGSAVALGGGMDVRGSTITDCLIAENVASKGGGVYVTGDNEEDYSELNGVLIERNSASDAGGGVYVSIACSTLFHVTGTICQNTPDGYCDDCSGCFTTDPQCPCPGDVDADAHVNFADILAILIAWGNAGGPEDLDGSGTVDFGDLLVVLSSWGPCVSGACCFADASCLDDTAESDCVAMGGSYGGHDSACIASCRTGACCFDDGTCANLTPEACGALGGSYRGSDSTCAATCLGACCFDDGTCVEATVESDCIFAGGTYGGDATTCGTICVGGCCLEDASCVDRTLESDCVSMGGIYKGDGTTCGGRCRAGACCLEVSCVFTTEDECGAMGGTYRGDETTCATSCDLASDDCVDASVHSDGSYYYSTIGATTDGPPLPPECDEGSGLGFERDVWFRYQASCDGTATASVCDSNFNTRLAVYDDGDCPGTFLACNDDACGVAGARSEVSFSVEEGGVYLIRIGSRTGSIGTGTLVLTCDP